MTYSALLFVEDGFHEAFLQALVIRIARERGSPIELQIRSNSGGFPRMKTNLTTFLRDYKRDRHPMPDLVIVGADTNCTGIAERRKELGSALQPHPELQERVCYALPDPHIERWMLLDPEAFKRVFSKGCTLPKTKCAKGEYKRLLQREIREAGIRPILGGQEFAKEIIEEMDLKMVCRAEPSLDQFVDCVAAKLNLLQGRAG